MVFEFGQCVITPGVVIQITDLRCRHSQRPSSEFIQSLLTDCRLPAYSQGADTANPSMRIITPAGAAGWLHSVLLICAQRGGDGRQQPHTAQEK